MKATKKVGLLGAGLMAYPVGEHLLKAGFSLTVYNRTKEKAQPLSALGASVVDTPKEVFEASDVTLALLFDYASVRNTVLSDPPSLRGKRVVQMSTIAPKENLALLQAVEEAGGEFIEAPVLGTRSVAQAGKLQVLVGAKKEQYDESLTDVLKAFGTPMYVGSVSAASTLKLILNQVVVGQTAILANSLAMLKKSEHLGLSEEVLFGILSQSALHCKYFDIKRPAMSSRNYDDVSFEIEGATKDIELIASEAATLGIDTTILDAFTQVYQKAAGEYPKKDFSVVYNAINPPEKKN